MKHILGTYGFLEAYLLGNLNDTRALTHQQKQSKLHARETDTEHLSGTNFSHSGRPCKN